MPPDRDHAVSSARLPGAGWLLALALLVAGVGLILSSQGVPVPIGLGGGKVESQIRVFELEPGVAETGRCRGVDVGPGGVVQRSAGRCFRGWPIAGEEVNGALPFLDARSVDRRVESFVDASRQLELVVRGLIVRVGEPCGPHDPK